MCSDIEGKHMLLGLNIHQLYSLKHVFIQLIHQMGMGMHRLETENNEERTSTSSISIPLVSKPDRNLGSFQSRGSQTVSPGPWTSWRCLQGRLEGMRGSRVDGLQPSPWFYQNNLYIYLCSPPGFLVKFIQEEKVEKVYVVKFSLKLLVQSKLSLKTNLRFPTSLFYK